MIVDMEKLEYRKWTKKVSGIMLVFLGFLGSCQNNFIYEHNFDVPNKTWDSDKAVRFVVNIEDTTAFYNLYVKLGNTEFYPYNNLWLFAKTIGPNKRAQIDTVEVFLADQTGKWFGGEKDGIWTGFYPFKMGIGFPRKGEYQFQLVQGMRREHLEDVHSVGLAIEKIDKQ